MFYRLFLSSVLEIGSVVRWQPAEGQAIDCRDRALWDCVPEQGGGGGAVSCHSTVNMVQQLAPPRRIDEVLHSDN